MGQSVERSSFEHRDFVRFQRALRAETDWLHDLVERDAAVAASRRWPGWNWRPGWSTPQGRPAPRNAEFIARCASPRGGHRDRPLQHRDQRAAAAGAGPGLGRLAAALQDAWSHCGEVAADMGLHVVAIGILPSLSDADLNIANLSEPLRYRALNQQVLRQRHGRPTRLDIDGPAGCAAALRASRT